MIVENTMTAGLYAAAQKVPGALGRALYEFAQTHVMAVAKDRTPVEYGTLRDSGLVEHPKTSGGTTSVTVGFGSAAAHYAIYVHEDLTAHHDVGQAKFLESAINEASAIFIEDVSARLARALGM